MTYIQTRACHFCQHSNLADDSDLTMVCDAPEVIGRGRAIPIRQARADSGPCGSEARFLEISFRRTETIVKERKGNHDPAQNS